MGSTALLSFTQLFSPPSPDYHSTTTTPSSWSWRYIQQISSQPSPDYHSTTTTPSSWSWRYIQQISSPPSSDYHSTTTTPSSPPLASSSPSPSPLWLEGKKRCELHEEDSEEHLD